MAKVSFTNLKLKMKTEVETINYNGIDIEIKSYLPIEDKYDLIMITLQEAQENGIFNPIKLEMYFHLNIIYMYTNINFTDKQKENKPKLYDLLESNGLIEDVLMRIPEEYEVLNEYLEEMIEDILNYKNTAASVIQSFINDLPKNAEIASKIVDSFDPQKYQAVIDFATAANGGRDITTNK